MSKAIRWAQLAECGFPDRGLLKGFERYDLFLQQTPWLFVFHSTWQVRVPPTPFPPPKLCLGKVPAVHSNGHGFCLRFCFLLNEDPLVAISLWKLKKEVFGRHFLLLKMPFPPPPQGKFVIVKKQWFSSPTKKYCDVCKSVDTTPEVSNLPGKLCGWS